LIAPFGGDEGRLTHRLSWPLRIIAGILLLLTIPASSEGADLFALQGRVPRTVPQGGVFALRLRPASWIDDLRGSLDGRSLIFSDVGGGVVQALVGIDLDASGRRLLRLEAKDRQGRGHVKEWSVRVRPRRFPVQRLTLPKDMVELDQQAAMRVAEESSRLNDLWTKVTPRRIWRGSFLPPLPSGAKPEGYGRRRIINNQPRSPHSGADYKAPQGSVVRASNAARVAVAEEQFFGGKSVVLDHGLGLYTVYFHLQEFLVKPGDVVEKGQQIGRVGATGRASGPHLHFGIRLNGARVDPAALLRLRLP
jgi:murein DD-endopeptidase MepM/ murein hydrolase activator NlpD